MSDPDKKSEPDEELLEFLGGIDEVNEDFADGDFADFLAKTDVDGLAGQKPRPPAEEKPRE